MNDLLSILAEALLKWQRPCRRYGLDITDVDLTVHVEPSKSGWRIYAMSPNHLVKI